MNKLAYIQTIIATFWLSFITVEKNFHEKENFELLLLGSFFTFAGISIYRTFKAKK